MFASKDALFAKSSGYQISRSLRIRSSASAYLSRTLGTPTSAYKFTYSVWLKRGSLSGYQAILWIGQGPTGTANYIQFYFDTSANNLGGGATYSSANAFGQFTSAVYRDTSAWYHVVISVDTTQATSTNRVIYYVNGVQQASSISTAIAQNTPVQVSGYTSWIGSSLYNTVSNPFDGYLAEVNFIDGQALTPSSFGAFDGNGVWQPAKYTGSYGANGFYLNFSDNSGATATTIGKDSSGNSNNWTPNNISVTSGTTYDSMIDSPTNYADGGNGRGNYPTLNPLSRLYNANFAASDGNLKAYASTADAIAFTTMPFPKQIGKWYAECTIGAISGTAYVSVRDVISAGTDYSYTSTGSISGTTSGATYTVNDIIGVAYDWSAQTIAWYKNGSLQGTTPSVSQTLDLSFANYIPNTSTNYIWNFGQRPFTYTPPSGFSALNTQNLPTPTIAAGNKYFDADLYSGNGTSSNTITNATFQPDFLWIKNRSAATSHILTDAVRGVANVLITNTTSADQNIPTYVTSYTATGFTVGTSASDLNASSNNYVYWAWKANGSGSTNTSGSITSTVSANTSAGFSVVTYSGTGASPSTIGHGLGVTPSMVIIKNRSAATVGAQSQHWIVYNSNLSGSLTASSTTFTLSTTAANVLELNLTAAVNSYAMDAQVNASGYNYVAYCFAPVAGYSAFGSYTGNGSADGPFVYCGFRPRYVLMKRTDTTGDWQINDTGRNGYNQADARLWADIGNAETANGAAALDFLSNGFKFRSTASPDSNASGGTYIYAAFAENPLKFARAR